MRNLLRHLGVLFLLLGCWELTCRHLGISAQLLPPPSRVGQALGELLVIGIPPGKALLPHAWHSLGRVLTGSGLAILLGLPLGLALGASPRLCSLTMPLVDFLRPIPPLAWVPLAILWFGLGLGSAAYLIFLGSFFPVVLATCSGVRNVDALYIESVSLLGASRFALWRTVLLPGAMPSILTGIQLGMGIGWMTLVAAEFTGVRSGYGLGYMIMSARDLQRTDAVMAGMVTIGLIGLGMEFLLRRLGKHLLRWK